MRIKERLFAPDVTLRKRMRPMKMTIKKRLFASNLLMIFLPVILSIGVSYLILFLFTRPSEVKMERAFPDAFGIVSRFQRDGDVSSLIARVDEFNTSFDDDSLFLVVVKDGEIMVPADAYTRFGPQGDAAVAIFRAGGTGSLLFGNVQLVIYEAGDYAIAMADTDMERNDFYQVRRITGGLFIIFAITIGAILITNRILTYILTRSITSSLDTLAVGVGEIREGNLDYRIHYTKMDEFTPVCDSFNQMAERLQALTLQQQRDDTSLRELLAGVSHDLRTPLTSIKAYVEGLLDGVAEDLPSQLRYLGIIRQKAEEIDALVDKLFMFSKINIGDYPMSIERLSLTGELRAMADLLREEYAEKGLDLTFELPDGDILIMADRTQLRGAIVNVLENSAKYRDKPEGHVHITCWDEGDEAVLTLTDDGPGVPEPSLERIFEVFYRGDASRQNPAGGSGLGLAITHKVMGKMGGSIRAENASEGGLRMILRFPAHEKEV